MLAVTSQRPHAFTASDDHVLASLADFVRQRARHLSSELARRHDCPAGQWPATPQE
ncbi:MAG: hypothetical protein V9G10_10770 [Candidatus Nanopelagicales bacterium]